jgi:hypothetical protein
MSGQAQITSVEAIEVFRSDLIVYLSQMKPVLDEVSSELGRTKYWLQNEQRQYWETQLRLRRRKLEEAQAELFSAKVSTIQTSTALQTMAVQRALSAVREAEEKLARLKKWDREMEHFSDPLLKQIEQLQGYLATDMAKAVVYLTQVIQALEAYREVASLELPTAPIPPTDAEPNQTSP